MKIRALKPNVGPKLAHRLKLGGIDAGGSKDDQRALFMARGIGEPLAEIPRRCRYQRFLARGLPR
jgi:hypothetical protein